jgi:hypothetical protein
MMNKSMLRAGALVSTLVFLLVPAAEEVAFGAQGQPLHVLPCQA